MTDNLDQLFIQAYYGGLEADLWHLATHDPFDDEVQMPFYPTVCGLQISSDAVVNSGAFLPSEDILCQGCEVHLERLGITDYRR